MKTLYTYKEKDYYTTGKALMKNPETREWQKAVLYSQVGLDLVFCREKKEFEKLFKYVGQITD